MIVDVIVAKMVVENVTANAAKIVFVENALVAKSVALMTPVANVAVVLAVKTNCF